MHPLVRVCTSTHTHLEDSIVNQPTCPFRHGDNPTVGRVHVEHGRLVPCALPERAFVPAWVARMKDNAKDLTPTRTGGYGR